MIGSERMRLPVAAKIALHSRAWYRMIDLELLNYDLQEYVCEDSNWLDHPLVRRELRSEEDIAKANEDFEMKTRGISEAVENAIGCCSSTCMSVHTG